MLHGSSNPPEPTTQLLIRMGASLNQALHYREIVDLVYYHEKSIEECAQVLAIPAATVKDPPVLRSKKLPALVEQAFGVGVRGSG